jgi:hypothetical protein
MSEWLWPEIEAKKSHEAIEAEIVPIFFLELFLKTVSAASVADDVEALSKQG